MLYGEQSRLDLNDHLNKLILTATARKTRQNIYDQLSDKFNMSITTSDAMLTGKKDISEFTTFEVFCLLYVLENKSLGKYFTKKEIDSLSKEKFDVDTIEFPIVFNNMVEISYDQYIGKISLQELMKLKKAQMINYDPNEQRALKRIKNGNTELWKPWVSNKNVKEIKESMLAGTYIPDPLTLNMPEGSEYKYNSETHSVTVNLLPRNMFNLDDGYHRYLAMSQIHDFDKEFDYTMELRLVGFDNVKANRFIFQQDQKTPMRKIVSDSYDPSSVANRIIQRMNADPNFDLNGQIGRNNELINGPLLGKLISGFYTRKVSKQEENLYIVETKNELVRKFNILCESNVEYMKEKWPDMRLMIAMYIFTNDDIAEKKYNDAVQFLERNINDGEAKLLGLTASGKIRRSAITLMQNKLKGWR